MFDWPNTWERGFRLVGGLCPGSSRGCLPASTRLQTCGCDRGCKPRETLCKPGCPSRPGVNIFAAGWRCSYVGGAKPGYHVIIKCRGRVQTWLRITATNVVAADPAVVALLRQLLL